MPWTPNPDVPEFVPKSVAPNPVNGQKPITILSKQREKSATNKTSKKSIEENLESTEGKKSESTEEKKSETNSCDGKFTIRQVDFPSMVSEPQPQEDLIWSRAGFRSFKDVAASSPLPKPCSSKTIELMEVSSGKQNETGKKKKKSKKKSEDVDAKPVKTKPKSQGMTLDQIVVAKFIQEVSKKTSKRVEARGKKSRNHETSVNQLKSVPRNQQKLMPRNQLESVPRNQQKSMPRNQQKSVPRNQLESMPRNQLDSTAPRVRKGKTREVPRKKKPTTLKKFIIMEKELRKRNLVASKEFKRRNLELVVDAAIKSVDFSDLTSTERRCEDSGHTCEEVEKKDMNDLTKDMNDLTKDMNDLTKDMNDLTKDSGRACEEVEKKDMNDLMSSMESLSLEEKVSHLIHCNYYRDYCNQCVTDEIDHLATNLLVDIVRFQDRMHAKDPQKASIKRRYCCGLREVEKYLTIKKVKCLLLAPDIQRIMANGVLDQTVHKLVEKSRESETQIVFCLSRKQLGYLCKKRANISCVAILNPSGADDTFKSLLHSAMDARREYEDLRNKITFLLSEEGKEEREGKEAAVSKECLSKVDEVRRKMRRQTFFWKRKKIEK